MPGDGGAAGRAMWVCAVLAALPFLAAAEAAGRYRAVFNFGDSLVDAGNLVTEGIPDYLATARLPYGQTYFGYPTGRCSDGRLVVDFIAQEFGLPLLPPSKAKNASFAQGANFAITGATALDTDFFQKRGLGKTVWNSGSLFTQIQWLRDLKPSLCSSAQECKEFFAKCLFIVGEFGGNDYNAPLFAGKDLKEAYKLMPHVIQGISDGVEQLIAEGAKDLIVPSVVTMSASMCCDNTICRGANHPVHTSAQEIWFYQCAISPMSLKAIRDAAYERMAQAQQGTLPVFL